VDTLPTDMKVTGTPTPRRLAAVAGCFCGFLGAGLGLLVGTAGAGGATGYPPAISVAGNLLMAGGRPIQLRGVDRGAYALCDGGTSADNDGPVDQPSVDAMKAWNINVVRVTINPNCWVGIPGVTPADSTPAEYRQEVIDYVDLLGENGLYVILDVQSTAPGNRVATMVDNLPDEDHMPAFWTSAAQQFAGDGWVMFDLVNEFALGTPQDFGNQVYPTAQQAWSCWLNGCAGVPSVYGSGVTYTSAGMQELVNDVRASGATNPLIVGSLDYDSDQTQWLQYMPTDRCTRSSLTRTSTTSARAPSRRPTATSTANSSPSPNSTR
jgi:hypothetical protein